MVNKDGRVYMIYGNVSVFQWLCFQSKATSLDCLGETILDLDFIIIFTSELVEHS